MKSIILLILVISLSNCTTSANESNPNITISQEIGSEISEEKDRHICHCFLGNELEYEFIFPEDCESKDSLFIFIPDTTSFHEDRFQRKMFNLYKDIVASLQERKFSGKTLSYYDANQKHLALELNMVNGEMHGDMKAYSFEGEIVIERTFKNGSLVTAKNDIGNTNWLYNKESNELTINPAYLDDDKISILFSPDSKHQTMMNWATNPEGLFDKSKPLKVNGKLFSGCLLYYGDHEGFKPLPIAKLNFVNGILDGKTIKYGDYDNYPLKYDPWVVTEEIYFSDGVKSADSLSMNEFFLYEGSIHMTKDEEQVNNHFQLSFQLKENSILEGGRLGLTQGFPFQFYILRGEKRGKKLEIEMVSVSDSRMSTVQNAIAKGKRYKISFSISGNSLKYIDNSEECSYCASGLILNKYDPDESEFVRFLKPY